MSDFTVGVRLRTLAGATMFDLHDPANGYDVLAPVVMPDEVWRRGVERSIYVDGSSETAAVLDSGTLEVQVCISGATWSQVESRRLAARAAWIDVPSFLIDVNLEGVTQSWRANRPDVTSLAADTSDLMARSRIFRLSFPVQPNPTVSGV